MSAGASVLLVRAGALGDLLLLRRAVLCLGAARHEVSLMAPRAPGGALLGRGPADVATVLDWDSADTAPLLAGELPVPARSEARSSGTRPRSSTPGAGIWLTHFAR